LNHVPKLRQIARIGRAMDHAMAVGTQHRKIRGNVIVHSDALFERADRLEVMRFNKTLTHRTIAFRKTEITGLAARAMKLLGLFDRGAVALNFAVIGIFAGFGDGGGLCNAKLFREIGLSFDIGINAAAISECPIGSRGLGLNGAMVPLVLCADSNVCSPAPLYSPQW
jgi:hypothetical protein